MYIQIKVQHLTSGVEVLSEEENYSEEQKLKTLKLLELAAMGQLEHLSIITTQGTVVFPPKVLEGCILSLVES